MPCFVLTAPQATALVDLVGGMVSGPQAAATGVMTADEYEALAAEVRRAHGDPAYSAHLVRFLLMVATVGTKPADR